LLRLDGTPPAGTRLPSAAGRPAPSRQLATADVDTYDGQCEQVPGTYSARYGEARLRNVPSSREPSQPSIPTTPCIAASPALSSQPRPAHGIVTRGSPRMLNASRTYLGPPHLTLARAVPACPPPQREGGKAGRGSRRLSELTRKSLHWLRVAMHNS